MVTDRGINLLMSNREFVTPGISLEEGYFKKLTIFYKV
jgi:hypothetical protein